MKKKEFLDLDLIIFQDRLKVKIVEDLDKFLSLRAVVAVVVVIPAVKAVKVVRPMQYNRLFLIGKMPPPPVLFALSTLRHSPTQQLPPRSPPM